MQHKLDFIEQHVPSEVTLILVGHSVGCYVILEMLDRLKTHRVLKCALLFPTIERLALTDSGKFWTPFLKHMRWAASHTIRPATLLPASVQRSILEWYFKDTNTSDCGIDATLKLVDPECLKNIAYMAHDEFQEIVQPNHDVIDKHLDKLWFYYGASDHWVPVKYYEDMKAKYPTANIQLCQDDIQHAFCLDAGSSMAIHVVQWLNTFMPNFQPSS